MSARAESILQSMIESLRAAPGPLSDRAVKKRRALLALIDRMLVAPPSVVHPSGGSPPEYSRDAGVQHRDRKEEHMAITITIKGLKHYPKLSRGTLAFSTSVYVDGKRAGEVSNDGGGGAHRYEPYTLEEVLKAHAETLPNLEYGDGRSYAQDADMVITQLVVRELTRRDLTTALKTKILYTRKDKSGLFQVPMKPGTTPEGVAANPIIDKVLNTLPAEEALDLYIKAMAPASG